MQSPSLTGQGAPARVFRQNLTMKTLGCLIIIAIAALVGIFVLPDLFPVTMPRATRATLSLGAVVLVAVIMILATFVWGNTRTEVSADRVEIRRPGKTIHSFDRASTAFSTHVVRQTTNGIASGTTRTLIAHTPGRTTHVNLGKISRKNFNELYALVTAPKAAGTLYAASADATAANLRSRATGASTTPAVGSFTTTGSVLSSMRLTTVLVLGITLVLVGGLVILMQALDEDFSAGGFILAGVIGSVGILFLAIFFVLRFTTGKVPTRIEVSSTSLTLDDTVYPYASLSRIWVTPPSYDVRILRLIGPTGVAKKYNFGPANVRMDKQTFLMWGPFVETLQAATAQQYPGLVAVDLQ